MDILFGYKMFSVLYHYTRCLLYRMFIFHKAKTKCHQQMPFTSRAFAHIKSYMFF